MQHFTQCQLTACSHGSSALAELLVRYVASEGRWRADLVSRLKFLIVVYFASYYFGYFSFLHAVATFVVKVMGQDQNVILSYVKDRHYSTALCGAV